MRLFYNMNIVNLAIPIGVKVLNINISNQEIVKKGSTFVKVILTNCQKLEHALEMIMSCM